MGLALSSIFLMIQLSLLLRLSGGPSEALGIQAGDKIIKVDEKAMAGIGVTSPDVMKALKGPRGEAK